MMCYVFFGIYSLAIVVLGLLLTIFCVLKFRRKREILGQSFQKSDTTSNFLASGDITKMSRNGGASRDDDNISYEDV